jgi:hypothetical protein
LVAWSALLTRLLLTSEVSVVPSLFGHARASAVTEGFNTPQLCSKLDPQFWPIEYGLHFRCILFVLDRIIIKKYEEFVLKTLNWVQYCLDSVQNFHLSSISWTFSASCGM